MFYILFVSKGHNLSYRLARYFNLLYGRESCTPLRPAELAPLHNSISITCLRQRFLLYPHSFRVFCFSTDLLYLTLIIYSTLLFPF